MTTPLPNTASARTSSAHRRTLLAGALAVIVGGLVLVGWGCEITALKSLLPGWVPVMPNTALAFILTGLALLGARQPATWLARLARGCGWLAGLIGLLTLGECISGWNPGFDQWLFLGPAGPVGAASPGQMAPDTALCFVLLATGLEVARTADKRRFIATVILGALVMTLAVAAMLTYFTMSLGPVGWGGLTNMAAPTAAVLAILGAALADSGCQPGPSLWSLGRGNAVTFGVGLALLAGIGLYTSRNVTRLDKTLRLVAHTQDVLHHATEALAEAAEAQTHTRSFVLTGDERYRQSQLAAAARYRAALAELRQLVAVDRLPAGLGARLDAQVNELLQWFARIIDAHRSGAAVAVESDLVNHGEMLLENLRLTIQELEQEENASLEAHQRESATVSRVTQTVIVTGTVTGLIVLLSALLGLNRSVTRRHRTEETLRVSEEQFRNMFESASIGMAQADPQSGRWLRVNQKMCAITGYSAAELLQMRVPEITHPDDRQADWAAFQQVVRGEAAEYRLEKRYRRQDGAVAWVNVNMTVLRDAAGQVTRTLATIEDITARKQSEQALRESNRQLEEALVMLRQAQSKMLEHERLRVVGQMAGGIAHNFNNALSPIIGFCEMLLEQPDAQRDPAKLRQYLELILGGARDAASVVRRLRELYRRPDERDALQPVNLSQLVHQVLALTAPRWKAQTIAAGKPVLVAADLAEVPLLAGNESELREVLTNLIFNAVEAMPDGGTLRLGTRQDEQTVVVEVGDTGNGMSPEVQRRCFETFFTTKGTQGTGLGLATVRAIIEQHDGTIALQTAPGQGATFTIRLPIRTVPNAAAPPPVRHGPARHGQLLLVEDEPMVRELFAEYLRQEGHTVVVAEDGLAGLKTFQAGTFDLVITDMAMPGLNGEQLAAKIRALVPQMPVLLLTGFGDIMNARGERPPGVDAVVGKPVSLAALRETVQDALWTRPERQS